MNDQPRLDKSTYDASRIYLKDALEYMLEAGRGVREFSEFALDRFGADFLPYLRQFLHEVGQRRVSIRGLSRDARSALAGNSVSSERRECMIRESAYLRAEARGFCGGSPEQDWLEAEKEVDLRLAQGPGLIAKGGQTLTAVRKAVEQELAGTRDTVARWLGVGLPAGGSGETGGAASRATRSAGRAARASGVKRKASPQKTPPAKKTATKKTATKKTATKKTGTKKTATKKTATKKKTAKVKKVAAKKAAAIKGTTRKTAGSRTVKKVSAPARGSSSSGAATRRKTAAKKKAATAATGKKTAAGKRAAGTGRARKTRRGGTRPA